MADLGNSLEQRRVYDDVTREFAEQSGVGADDRGVRLLGGSSSKAKPSRHRV